MVLFMGKWGIWQLGTLCVVYPLISHTILNASLFPFMHLWSPLKLADVKLLIECALTPNKVLFVWNLIQLLVNITSKRKFSRILNSIAITTGVTFLAHIDKRQIDLTHKHIKEMNQHKELWSWQTSSPCPSGPPIKIEKISPLSAFVTWNTAIQQHCIR